MNSIKVTLRRPAVEWEASELRSGTRFSQKSVYGVYLSQDGQTVIEQAGFELLLDKYITSEQCHFEGKCPEFIEPTTSRGEESTDEGDPD